MSKHSDTRTNLKDLMNWIKYVNKSQNYIRMIDICIFSFSNF